MEQTRKKCRLSKTQDEKPKQAGLTGAGKKSKTNSEIVAEYMYNSLSKEEQYRQYQETLAGLDRAIEDMNEVDETIKYVKASFEKMEKMCWQATMMRTTVKT